MYKKLILLTCMLCPIICEARIITFINNSPFTLTLNQAQPGPSNTCLNNEFKQAACSQLLLPEKSQSLQIAEGSGFNLNYNINALVENNYNLNIQNQNSVITFNASTIDGASTNQTDSNTIVFSANSLGPNPVFNVSRYTQLPFVGVNLSGAETGRQYVSAWLPSAVDAQYFVNTGMNTVRVPINWNFLTPTADVSTVNQLTPANKIYLDSIYSSVQQLLHSGVNVVLDLHDYMRYQTNSIAGTGDIVSPAQVKAVWTLLATKFSGLANTYDGSSQPNQLIFEIMNEPDKMSTNKNPAGVKATLVRDNYGIAAIRSVGLKNFILIEGDFWSGMHSWLTSTDWAGETNAQVFVPANIQDSANNYAIAVHEYFDQHGSGNSPLCRDRNSFQNYVNFPGFYALGETKPG